MTMVVPSDSVQAQAGAPSLKQRRGEFSGVLGPCLGGGLGTRSIIFFAVAILMIVLGFWTLTRGSLTLAPLLLVAGYCVVVPLAIMARDGKSESGSDEDERANSSAG